MSAYRGAGFNLQPCRRRSPRPAAQTDAALRRPCPRFLHASAALGPCRAVRGQQTSGVGRKARARTRKLHAPASHWPLPVAALHMKVRHRECCSISRKAKSSFSSLLCCCCSLILSLTFDELCGSDPHRSRIAQQATTKLARPPQANYQIHTVRLAGLPPAPGSAPRPRLVTQIEPLLQFERVGKRKQYRSFSVYACFEFWYQDFKERR